jgi:hypothetical protein
LATKTKFTAEQKQAWKEEKQAEQKQLLEDAFAQLTSQEDWTNWIKFGRKNLSKYSFHNSLMIWARKRNATLVHGKKQWEKEGVALNPDAQALPIFAPQFVNMKDENGNIIYDNNGKPKRRIGWYKVVYVYDISDTNAPEPKDPAIMREIEGDDLVDYLPEFESFARELGFVIRYREDTGEALGWCDFYNREIIVNKNLSGNAIIRTLVHELAHAYGDINYTDYDRGTAEVIVESATVMTLGMLGYDVRNASVPYIAEWGNGDMKLLKSFAATIDDLVKTLTSKAGM